MIDLVVHALKQDHPALAPSGAVDSVRRAHVTAQFKRDILDYVWREAGPEALLSIGRAIRAVEYDPIWHAALRSTSPVFLFEKWRRFEVFAHSQNRLRIDRTNENRASFQRYTVDGGMPTRPENLLICGLIIALLEEIGCLGIRCEMPLVGGAAHLVYVNGGFRLPEDADTLVTTAWTIAWRRFSPRVENTVSEAEPPPVALPQSCDSALKASIETVVRLLALDAARQWKIGELAREVGFSTRSLQRLLAAAGLSFSHLVRLVRVHEACRLLKSSDAPITTIGFCAGFSDSAHFSRDFRAGMGMTPSDYRAAI